MSFLDHLVLRASRRAKSFIFHIFSFSALRRFDFGTYCWLHHYAGIAATTANSAAIMLGSTMVREAPSKTNAVAGLSGVAHPDFKNQHYSTSETNRKINQLVRCGDVESARQLFEAMPAKNPVSWNSILAAYSKRPGHLCEALQLFTAMPSPDIVSFNTMLFCYFRNGNVNGACQLFEKMPFKDCFSWNIMISGLSEHNKMDEAECFFTIMPVRNLVSWNAIISGFVRAGNLHMAEEYFSRAPDKSDIILQTVMITGYMSCGKVNMAESVFHNMPVRNLVTWNTMISGYIDNQRPECALKTFREIVCTMCLKPNSSTLSSVLLGCSNLSALGLGKQIHQFAWRVALILDPAVETSLVSMYCKCGDLDNARKMFDGMHRRDVVCWNAMMSGYAQHGYGMKTIKLFHGMKDNGILPNEITFVAALLACIHAGMVDAGRSIFDSIKAEYGIEPWPDHYYCMVDLLCRAGFLTEAVKFIYKMPFTPHQAVFGTLLGACRIQKNLELAEFAAQRLLELEPKSAGAYVQLANVYAATNRWDDVSKVRRLMKNNKVVKTPGYSWIEVKNVIHVFRSGDRVHRQLNSIHAKLSELEMNIKNAGYVLDLGSSLHDVGLEQKEQLLSKHSEKLALAFGLITLPKFAIIRIFKNLRVCVDCHNAIKFISMVEGRYIIVRDTTRFHHFSKGHCSCGDFW